MADLLDFIDLQPAQDVVAELWGHPHWDHGCDLVLEVSNHGLVYCGDCASQIGSVPVSLAGLKLGKGGKAQRWLSHEAIEQAWKQGGKEK